MSVPKLSRAKLAQLHREYMLGESPDAELCDRYGISKETLARHIKRYGWNRDELAIKVREEAERKIAAARGAVGDSHITTPPPGETSMGDRYSQHLANKQAPDVSTMDSVQDIVEARANIVQQVLLEHRSAISGAKRLCGTLLLQLQEAILARAELEEAVDAETAEDRNTMRRNAMLAAISLPTHISSMQKLAQAYDTWISLEREAFGIAKVEDVKPRDTLQEFLSGLAPSLAPPSSDPTVGAASTPPKTEAGKSPTTAPDASGLGPTPTAEQSAS